MRIGMWVCGLVLIASPAISQESLTDRPAIVVTGRGQAEQVPDTFRVSADIEGRGSTQVEALSSLAEAQQSVTQALEGAEGLDHHHGDKFQPQCHGPVRRRLRQPTVRRSAELPDHRLHGANADPASGIADRTRGRRRLAGVRARGRQCSPRYRLPLLRSRSAPPSPPRGHRGCPRPGRGPGRSVGPASGTDLAYSGSSGLRATGTAATTCPGDRRDRLAGRSPIGAARLRSAPGSRR